MSRSFLQQRTINLAPYPCNNSQSIAVFEYSGTDPLPSPTADVNFYYLNGNGIGVVNLQLPLSNSISTSQELFIINTDVNQVIGLYAEAGSSINDVLSPSIWITLGVNEGTLVRKSGTTKLAGIRLPTGFTLSNAVPSSTLIGNIGNSGVSPEASRSDHVHALPNPGSPETAVGDTNLAGTSTNVARQDHKHRIEIQIEDVGVFTGSRPTLNITGAIISDDNINDRINIDIPNTPLSNANPSTLNIGDIGDPGISPEASRSDHIHTFPAPGDPLNVNKTIANAGISVKAAREDHKHDIDTAAPVTVMGTTNNEGISTSLARSDHQHRLELQVEDNAILTGSRPILNFIGATVVDDGINDRVDITIPSPTTLSNNNPVNVSYNSISPGVSNEASRSDHKHDIDVGIPITVIGTSNLLGTSTSLSLSDHQHRLEVQVQEDGVLTSSRPILNFINATVTDDGINDRATITIPALATTTFPTQIDVGDASVIGISDEIARADHQHALPSPSAPETASGTTNLAGTSTNVARQDHIHRIELGVYDTGVLVGSQPYVNFVGALSIVNDAGNNWVTVTFPTLTAVSPANVNKSAAQVGILNTIARADHKHDIDTATPTTATGTTNIEGVSTSLARADHVHRIEVGVQNDGLAVGSQPYLNIVNASSITNDAGNNRVIITLPPLASTNPTTLQIGDTASAGTSSQTARADHTHAFPSPSAPANVTKAAASAGISTNAARADHKHDVDTAAPSTVIGGTNSEGTSTSLARADHIHRLGLQVQSSGVLTGTRPIINFSGATVADDGGNDRINITIPTVYSLATPLNVTANGTQSLSGSEITLMSGNITVPSNSSGNIMILFTGNGTLGSFIAGTNGIQIRLRFNGSIITTSTRVMQYTATLSISLTVDSEEMGTQALQTGITAGTYLVEVLAVKIGAVSTASFTGNRSLIAFSV